jgi:hypothetical protein
LNPALPDCLVEIIRSALAKNTEQRFRTGEQMASAIRQCAMQLSSVDVSL